MTVRKRGKSDRSSGGEHKIYLQFLTCIIIQLAVYTDTIFLCCQLHCVSLFPAGFSVGTS